MILLLARKFRLRKKKHFAKAYTHGKSLANPYLVLYYFKRSEPQAENSPRIGFSVSKKLGNAVIRNKIKRRLRAAAKPLLQDIKQEYDLIFIARIKIKGISFSDVEKNMLNLLLRAHLIKSRNEA